MSSIKIFDFFVKKTCIFQKMFLPLAANTHALVRLAHARVP